MTIHVDYGVPSICLYYSSDLDDLNRFNEILWGMEEEGIPCEVLTNEENLSSEKLSHKASHKSRLAVGIGIDNNGRVTLTHNKLKEQEPLFIKCLDSGNIELRKLGANAGRLVKGIAFK